MHIGLLNVGETHVSNVATPETVDLHAINLFANTQYSFIAYGSEHGGGTLSDPFLAIYDSNLTTLYAAIDDTATTLDPAMNFVAPYTGTFLIGVGDAGNDYGTYTMMVVPTAQVAPANSPIAGPVLPVQPSSSVIGGGFRLE